MAIKFTPAPWRVGKNRPIVIKAGNTESYHIAEIRPQGWMTEPNARLIAAAPEMYKLIQRMVTLFDGVGTKATQDAAALLARIDGDDDD